jgi:hypothetical protein
VAATIADAATTCIPEEFLPCGRNIPHAGLINEEVNHLL